MVVPSNTGWRRIDVEHSIAALREPWATPGTATQAAEVLKKMKPKDLLVVDTFWGFAYYPFGVLARQHVDSICTDDGCGATESSLKDALVKHTEVVWANKNSRWPNRFKRRLKSCLVYGNSDFRIYRLNDACRKQLE
jgi:hypothetical protein